MCAECQPSILYSLWDLMEIFKSREFAMVLINIQEYMDECEIGKRMANDGKGSHHPHRNTIEEIMRHLSKAKELCSEVGFAHAKDTISLILIHIHDDDIPSDYSDLFAKLESARDAILSDHWKWKFVSVAPSATHFIHNQALFGSTVNDAFSDSVTDLTEAGNCLACGCGTATVFHLMRAAEFALRALARDRSVSFCDKPIEDKEWGQLLVALESKLTELRNEPTAKWQQSAFKETQVRFYHEVIQELRSFNEAWRRHISHADSKAFYDTDHATSIMNHVKQLMVKLSERITQTKITPHYWDFA